MLLELGGARAQAIAVSHAPGELQEALREDALAAVAADDAGIVGDARECRIGHLARDALRHRLPLEVLEPALERRVVAARRGGRRLRHGASEKNRAQINCSLRSHHSSHTIAADFRLPTVRSGTIRATNSAHSLSREGWGEGTRTDRQASCPLTRRATRADLSPMGRGGASGSARASLAVHVLVMSGRPKPSTDDSPLVADSSI